MLLHAHLFRICTEKTIFYSLVCLSEVFGDVQAEECSQLTSQKQFFRKEKSSFSLSFT